METATTKEHTMNRMICTEDGTEIREATPAEIAKSDETIEGWITVADIDGKVYVDGEAQ